ncbi:hypothetical protein Q3G72_013356 [Acer saccharum]|nr:hypothetical protein Q3G72_013356 [Acer saccharum]
MITFFKNCKFGKYFIAGFGEGGGGVARGVGRRPKGPYDEPVYPLQEVNYTALVRLLRDLDFDRGMNMRLFSAIDEMDSSNSAEQFLMSTHPELYFIDQFSNKYAGIKKAYRIEAEFKKDFHNLRKGLIDCFSTAIFSEKYYEELTKVGEPDDNKMTMKKEIENFFRTLGYNI